MEKDNAQRHLKLINVGQNMGKIRHTEYKYKEMSLSPLGHPSVSFICIYTKKKSLSHITMHDDADRTDGADSLLINIGDP